MADLQNIFNTNSSIVETWTGGYKLELDIAAKLDANGWELNFNTPHKIKEIYGVDLIDNGNGNYTIYGQNDQVNLQTGQSIQPVLIMEAPGEAVELDIVDGTIM
ncbi:MAG: hypothetical protein AAFO95_14345, partial [Cyanobacteria bacterium J06600_6]